MLNTNEKQLEQAINKLSKKIERWPMRKEWLRTEEVKDYLSISKSQVHVLKSEGILPFTKLNGTLFFKKSDIDSLLEDNMSN